MIARGHRGENIFQTDRDKERFLEKLGEVIEKFNLRLHCFVLMNTHYHILLETPAGNLSKSMHNLNTSYSNWFKTKYNIIGSIFQGRFKSILVEKEDYLLLLSSYIHLNPVRAGIVKIPEDYRWSSFKDYISEQKKFRLLFTETIMGMFSGNQQSYKAFVYSWMEKEIEDEEIYGKHSILGSEDFRNSILDHVGYTVKNIEVRETPFLAHLIKLKVEDIKSVLLGTFKISEAELYSKKKGNIYRKLFLYALKKYSDLNLREIGKIFEMDYSAVSQMVKRFVLESKENDRIKSMIEKLKEKLKKS